MRILYRYILGLLIVTQVSCSSDEIFDVKSDKSISTPVTLEELQALLDNPLAFNGFSPIIGENASDYHFFRASNVNRLNNVEKNSFTWSKDWVNVRVPDWSQGIAEGGYGRIFQSNLILEVLQKINRNENPALYDDIKGQALFQRARSYFELSQLFVPLIDNSNKESKFGLPIRIESDVSIRSNRSTVGETYDFILKDLNESLPLLPNLPKIRTRASRCAVFALLARYYLAMEKYSDARINALNSLNLYGELMKYSELDYTSNTNPIQVYNKEVIFYSYAYGGIGFTMARINIDSNLYKSYAVDDLRKSVFFRFDSNSGLVSFKGSYSGRGYDYFFSGLATDELYLIVSECDARLGNLVNAMKNLNLLLRTRWLSGFSEIETGNAEETLRLILNERKKELVFRGVRWSDLRRLNRDPRFAQTFTRNYGGKTFTLEPNSFKYTFPIPDDVIQLSDIKQSPGW